MAYILQYMRFVSYGCASENTVAEAQSILNCQGGPKHTESKGVGV